MQNYSNQITPFGNIFIIKWILKCYNKYYSDFIFILFPLFMIYFHNEDFHGIYRSVRIHILIDDSFDHKRNRDDNLTHSIRRYLSGNDVLIL